MADIQFWRSNQMSDSSFLDLVKRTFGKTFTNAIDAKDWLITNGYYTSYPDGIKIKNEHINTVGITGGVILSQGDIGPNSGYQISFRHDSTGCGDPESGIFIELKNFMNWTNISFEWLGTGVASCWGFCGGSHGAAAGPTSAYLQSYNENLGDMVFDTYLTWEVPEFQTHNKETGCDNNTDNFFRFNSDSYKSFFMRRRRDISGNMAGIHHGRSCNSTGAGSVTIIRNISVW